MKAETMSVALKAIWNEYDEKLNSYNKAAQANDLKWLNAAEKALKLVEDKYNEQSMTECFSTCKKAENFVVKAAELHDYEILSHKAVKNEQGVITGGEPVWRTKAINLVKLFGFVHVSDLWSLKTEKMGCYLCMRVADELGMTKKEIALIQNMYYMSEAAKKVDLGIDPVSNTQLCKLLQSVVDEIVFVDNGSGKNSLKVNNHDVSYLLHCYTKRDNKKLLSVSVAKTSYINTLILDILHRIVCKKSYDVTYKMVKDSKPSNDTSKTDVIAKA